LSLIILYLRKTTFTHLRKEFPVFNFKLLHSGFFFYGGSGGALYMYSSKKDGKSSRVKMSEIIVLVF